MPLLARCRYLLQSPGHFHPAFRNRNSFRPRDLGEVCVAKERAAVEVRGGEVRALEVCALEVRALEVRGAEVRAAEVRGAGNNRAGSTATASSLLNAGTRPGGQRGRNGLSV